MNKSDSPQMDMNQPTQGTDSSIGSAISMVKSFIQRPALATTQALDELLTYLEDVQGEETQGPNEAEGPVDLSSELRKGGSQ